MFSIDFIASVGDEKIKVNIGLPNGMGTDIYYVTIDNYHYGSITKRNGQWIRLHTNKGELTIDDIQILGEIIDKELNK